MSVNRPLPPGVIRSMTLNAMGMRDPAKNLAQLVHSDDATGGLNRADIINAIYNHMGQYRQAPAPRVPTGFGQSFPANASPDSQVSETKRAAIIHFLNQLGYGAK